MVDAALGAAQWVVAKALAPVADGMLGTWAACRNFGPNVEDLRMELLLVQATLEQAARKELSGPAMEMLLQKLRDLAHRAEDLLDELDYFCIHDRLHGTYDAADEHGKGCVKDIALSARHTAKALGKLINCCPWHHAKRQQRSQGNSSSRTYANQDVVNGCMPNLGKLLPCSSSSHSHAGDKGRSSSQETPKLEFNRADFSQSMKDIVEKLQLMRNEVNKIMIHCVPRIVTDITHSRPTTTAQSAEQNFCGRDDVMKSIIADITKSQYCKNGLTVLPVVGPGGMGKTTLIQQIYRNQQVQNHFPVMIWICVSLIFDLDKVLEQIKIRTPEVKGEKKDGTSTTEELIKQRLKSKRFLIVLDDIWRIRIGDDWEKLKSILNQSQEKGCMIIVTTRFPQIAQKVKTTGHSVELNGLEPGELKNLFHAFLFDDGQCPDDKQHLLGTGDKIVEKLKGSPLAAKTVGRLLKTDLSLNHWKKVLNSKEWEKQTDGIMPALKLSYDFLPFHLQQCFFYSALFPEDHRFRSSELISLWIGLDILIPDGQNQTFEEIGLRNLNALVVYGFFKEENDYDGSRYVMHDLLHDLALKVASHDCLSLQLSDVGPVEIKPSIRHLSISTDGLGLYDAKSHEICKSKLEELKTRLKVGHLQTLMLFGKINWRFAEIFSVLLGQANDIRVLYLPDLRYSMEFVLHNFLDLVHLRYLCLGTRQKRMNLPLYISKFYHLRILDLESWYGRHELPGDMTNLAKLCHFYTPCNGELHSDICNVGKLTLLEELKVFRVNKKSEGFEPKQLEHLTKLRELGMYNLEKIHTEKEADEANLIRKNYLRSLTLDWDNERSSVDPTEEAVVLESLQPPEDLQVLCIRGHKGLSCPTWLGDAFVVEALRSLCLDGVSWEVFPSLGKAGDLRELKLKDIAKLKEFIIEKSFCMLIKLELIGLGSLEKWFHPAEQESSLGRDSSPPDAVMFPHLQALIIRGCPKLLVLPFSNWFPKLQELEIRDCPKFQPVIPIPWIESLRHVNILCVKLLEEFAYSKSSNGGELKIKGIGGKELTKLLPHVPRLSKFEITDCNTIKQLLVGVDLQQTTSAASVVEEDEITAAEDMEEDDRVLLFPAHFFDSLQELVIMKCQKLYPVGQPTLVPGGGWPQALQSLQRLKMRYVPKFLSSLSFSRHIFPSSLQYLHLNDVEGMGTLEPLANLSNLTRLELEYCGEDLKCQGLESLVTTGGQLTELRVWCSPRFFAGWNPNPRQALEDIEGGEEQQTQLVSSTLREINTQDVAGLFAAPICSFLSSSLTKLEICYWYHRCERMTHFSKEQEDALQLLSSLQELEFLGSGLQQLPAGLRNLTSLKKLSIDSQTISALPKDGFPESLEELNVGCNCSEELKQMCRGLVGTIPTIVVSDF